MSKGSGEACEHASLLPNTRDDQMMNTLHYSSTNGKVTIQQGDSTQETSRSGAEATDRSRTFSDDRLESASLMGSVVQPQDLQELMANLEKATVLVRRYLQDNPVADLARKYVQTRVMHGPLTLSSFSMCAKGVGGGGGDSERERERERW